MDKIKFQTAFLALCEMYDKEVSKELTQLYFSVLEDAGLSDEDFDRASKHVMKTHKYNTLPKPVDFIEAASAGGENKRYLNYKPDRVKGVPMPQSFKDAWQKVTSKKW